MSKILQTVPPYEATFTDDFKKVSFVDQDPSVSFVDDFNPVAFDILDERGIGWMRIEFTNVVG